MSEPFIAYSRDREEYWFQEGCYITENLNTEQHPSLSVARARVKPGTSTRRHRLIGVTERYVILEGGGRVEVEGLGPAAVEAGDVVVIPAGVDQRVTNTGTGDLVFLAICTPRFTPGCYLNSDQEP